MRTNAHYVKTVMDVRKAANAEKRERRLKAKRVAEQRDAERARKKLFVSL